MSLSPTDQRDLVEPLFSGLLERPCWQTFLRRLVGRTGAERVGLRVRGPGGARLDGWGEAFEFSRSAREAREQMGDQPPPGLRPLRVYTFAEIAPPAAIGLMPTAMIAHGRWMRVPTAQGWNAWITLEHSTRNFTAADSALLSALGPFIATAIELLRELDLRTRRAEIAEHALETLGVSQALFDGERRVPMSAGAGDPATRSDPIFAAVSGGDAAWSMAALAAGEARRAVLTTPAEAGREVLLYTPPPSEAPLASPRPVVAAIRREGRASRSAMAEALIALHGLSPREADLAVALARGEELMPAGAGIGLTPETTRNYSKRIYAKTGTRGQADLVRLVLTGLAPLAVDA